MRLRLLAAMGVTALAASLIGAVPAQAAPPDAPLITSVSPGPVVGSVEVDWLAPNSPGITNYRIQFQTINPVGPWSNPVETEGPDTFAVVGGLTSGQQYIFQVSAQNADGWGPWSADSQPIAPTGLNPPGNLQARPGDGVVNLTWSAPSPPPLGYEIEYQRNVPGAPWQAAGATPHTAFRVEGLDATEQYFFRVRSTNGAGQTSTFVTTDAPVSPGVAPGPPTGIVAVAGDAQVALSWTAPFPAPDSYQVQYRVDVPGSPWLPASPLTAAGPTTTVTGLTNGTAYYFQVRSVRGSSQSAWASTSAPVTPTGTFVVPAAPSSVTGSPGNGLAFVYWTVPAGNPATSYDVRYSINNSAWTDPIRTNSTALNYTLTGLTNGVPYYIQVRTVNGTQVSAWTQMPGTVTPLGLPAAPTSVSGVPGNNQVTVSWIPPVNTGVAVTGYRVQYSVNGGAAWVPAVDLSVPTTTVVVGGLTNGVGYTFRVQAKSPSGDGPWSAVSATVVPPGGPNPPLSVTATAGNASATVSWAPPTGTQGFPLLGYRATAAPGGQTCTTSATPPTLPATSCTVTGLANGQTYTFTVVALSASGTSASSAASGPVVPVGGPNPPTNVTATAGDRQASVTWTAPASAAGGPLTGYRVISSPEGRSCATNATPPAVPATSCTVTGLTNGQPYTFTVVAISASGTSAPSAASEAVTPFTTQVTIRITDSSRNGSKITIKGTTQGLDPGDTLDVLIRNSSKGKFAPAGEVTIKSNGTFRWTTTNAKKTWIRVTDGDVVSNTVIIAAR